MDGNVNVKLPVCSRYTVRIYMSVLKNIYICTVAKACC